MKTSLNRIITFAVIFIYATGNLFAFPVLPASGKGFEKKSPALVSFISIPSGLGRVREATPQGRPQVILIQDAHAVPDAQRNIQKLIAHLQKQYGISQVAVEGASSELDGRLLHSFPERAQLERTLESYAQRGELTGATAAAILNEKAVFRGLEDWPLYEEGILLYLQAANAHIDLSRKRQKIEQLKEKFYSRGLFEVDRALEDFDAQKKALPEVLAILEKYLKPQGAGLKIVLEEMEREEKQGMRSADQVAHKKRLEQIQGPEFFAEFESYAAAVKNSLIRDEKEKKIDAASHRLRLYEKLSSLELTRAEWEELKAARAPQSSIFLPAFRFYENAEKRDGVFARKLSTYQEPVIFVGGGFHSEGLIRRFKQSGIRYALIMPEIVSLPEDISYQAQMRGDVSWKNYFRIENGKINLSAAFARAVRDQLLKADPQSLKLWRDELIRSLAASGDIARAGEFTKYLDEVSPKQNPGWMPRVEKFVDGLRELETSGRLTRQNILDLMKPGMTVPYAPANAVSQDMIAESVLHRSLPTALARAEARSTPEKSLIMELAQSGQPWRRLNGERFMIKRRPTDYSYGLFSIPTFDVYNMNPDGTPSEKPVFYFAFDPKRGVIEEFANTGKEQGMALDVMNLIATDLQQRNMKMIMANTINPKMVTLLSKVARDLEYRMSFETLDGWTRKDNAMLADAARILGSHDERELTVVGIMGSQLDTVKLMRDKTGAFPYRLSRAEFLDSPSRTLTGEKQRRNDTFYLEFRGTQINIRRVDFLDEDKFSGEKIFYYVPVDEKNPGFPYLQKHLWVHPVSGRQSYKLTESAFVNEHFTVGISAAGDPVFVEKGFQPVGETKEITIVFRSGKKQRVFFNKKGFLEVQGLDGAPAYPLTYDKDSGYWPTYRATPVPLPIRAETRSELTPTEFRGRIQEEIAQLVARFRDWGSIIDPAGEMMTSVLHDTAFKSARVRQIETRLRLLYPGLDFQEVLDLSMFYFYSYLRGTLAAAEKERPLEAFEEFVLRLASTETLVAGVLMSMPADVREKYWISGPLSPGDFIEFLITRALEKDESFFVGELQQIGGLIHEIFADRPDALLPFYKQWLQLQNLYYDLKIKMMAKYRNLPEERQSIAREVWREREESFMPDERQEARSELSDATVYAEVEAFINSQHKRFMNINTAMLQLYGNALLRRDTSERLFLAFPLDGPDRLTRLRSQIRNYFDNEFLNDLRIGSSKFNTFDRGVPQLRGGTNSLLVLLGGIALLSGRDKAKAINRFVIDRALKEILGKEPLYRDKQAVPEIVSANLKSLPLPADVLNERRKSMAHLGAVLNYPVPDPATDLFAYALISNYQSEDDATLQRLNNRLAFLGDALLRELMDYKYAFLFRNTAREQRPNAEILDDLVSDKSLTELAGIAGLDSFFYARDTTDPKNVTDGIEALFAAVYFSGGWGSLDRTVKGLFSKRLGAVEFNFKTLLEKAGQARAEARKDKRLDPLYKEIGTFVAQNQNYLESDLTLLREYGAALLESVVLERLFVAFPFREKADYDGMRIKAMEYISENFPVALRYASPSFNWLDQMIKQRIRRNELSSLSTVVGGMAMLNGREAAASMLRVLAENAIWNSIDFEVEFNRSILPAASSDFTERAVPQSLRDSLQPKLADLRTFLGFNFPFEAEDLMLHGIINDYTPEGAQGKEVRTLSHNLGVLGDALLREWAEQHLADLYLNQKSLSRWTGNDLDQLVSDRSLDQFLFSSGLKNFIYSAQEQFEQFHRKARTNSFEAFLGAVYLAGGWERLDQTAQILFTKGTGQKTFNFSAVLKHRPRAEARSKPGSEKVNRTRIAIDRAVVEQLIEQSKGNITAAEIAKKTGRTTKVILQFLQRTGLDSRIKKRPRRTLSPEISKTHKLLGELVLYPSDFNWKEHSGKVPDLSGMPLGETTANGQIKFQVKGFPFALSVLGKSEAGWDVVIEKAGVVENFYELKLKLKKGGKELTRTFQIGNKTKKIKKSGKMKEERLEVLRVDDQLGILYLKDILVEPEKLEWRAMTGDLPDLKGMRLGEANGQGAIIFPFAENFYYTWQIMSDGEEGWEAFVEESRVKERIYEFDVVLRRGTETVRKTFQLSPSFVRTVHFRNQPKSGKKKTVLEIGENLALQEIAKLVTKPVDFDWDKEKINLPSLDGLLLGETGINGDLRFRPIEHFSFGWPVLGFLEAGWKAVVIKSGVVGNYYQLSVRLTKEGRKPVFRIFQIGTYETEIPGREDFLGTKRRVLDIDDRLGLRALAALSTRSSDLFADPAQAPKLQGLQLGEVDSLGTVTIRPDSNYRFQLSLVGRKDAGWEALIEDSWLENSRLFFRVKLTKRGQQNIYRTFQFGPIRKEVKSVQESESEPVYVYQFTAIETILGLLRQDAPVSLGRASVYDRRVGSSDVADAVSDDPSVSAVAGEILAAVQQLTSTLTPEQAAIVSRIIEGDSDEDIAGEGTPITQVVLVRKILRDGLSKFNIDERSEARWASVVLNELKGKSQGRSELRQAADFILSANIKRFIFVLEALARNERENVADPLIATRLQQERERLIERFKQEFGNEKGSYTIGIRLPPKKKDNEATITRLAKWLNAMAGIDTIILSARGEDLKPLQEVVDHVRLADFSKPLHDQEDRVAVANFNTDPGQERIDLASYLVVARNDAAGIEDPLVRDHAEFLQLYSTALIAAMQLRGSRSEIRADLLRIMGPVLYEKVIVSTAQGFAINVAALNRVMAEEVARAEVRRSA